MVPVALGDSFGVIAFILLNANHLHGTRLASRGVRSAKKGLATGTKSIHINHGGFHQLQPFRLQRDTGALRRGHRGLSTATWVFERTHHPRLAHDPVGRQARRRARELQDGKRVIALTNTDRNRFTRQPLLLEAS